MYTRTHSSIHSDERIKHEWANEADFIRSARDAYMHALTQIQCYNNMKESDGVYEAYIS